jgi:hypothetical protein
MAINTTYTQSNASQKQDAPAFAAGRITFGADSITAADYVVQATGFTPRYIKVENVTDRISVEWYEGMAADTCIKTAAAGTKTLETTNLGLTVCDTDGTARTTGRAFKVSQNATLAVIAASKVLNWVALG